MTIYQNLTAIVAATYLALGGMGSVSAEEPKLPCAREVKASWEKFHSERNFIKQMKCVVLDEIEPPTRVCFGDAREGYMHLSEDYIKRAKNERGTFTSFRIGRNHLSKEPYLKEFYVKREPSDPRDNGTNYDSFELEKRPDLRKETGDKFCRYFKLALAQAEKDKNKPKEKKKSEVKPLSCESQVKQYWESDAYYPQNCIDLGESAVYLTKRVGGVGRMYLFENADGELAQATTFDVRLREGESTYYSGKSLEHPVLESVVVNPGYAHACDCKHLLNSSDTYCFAHLDNSSQTVIPGEASPRVREKAENKFCNYLAKAIAQMDTQTNNNQKQTEEEQLKLLESPKK